MVPTENQWILPISAYGTHENLLTQELLQNDEISYKQIFQNSQRVLKYFLNRSLKPRVRDILSNIYCSNVFVPI